MRVPWKLIGAAGAAGVAAATTGVAVQRRRRAEHEDLPADELRARLHRRLEEARGDVAPAPATLDDV